MSCRISVIIIAGTHAEKSKISGIYFGGCNNITADFRRIAGYFVVCPSKDDTYKIINIAIAGIVIRYVHRGVEYIINRYILRIISHAVGDKVEFVKYIGINLRAV